jgi:3-hydroxyacyl-[acyl-carrier-protein] dehydratase
MTEPIKTADATSKSSGNNARFDPTADENATPPMPMSVTDIMAILPHRYPMLMIDRIVEMTRRKRIVALKNVTINEAFFAGHFPGFPVMPGVLIVEAMAQAGAALIMTELPDREKKLILFSGIERAKFRKPVLPGDQLRIEVDVIVWRPTAGKMEGKAFIDGKLACEAVISCAVVNK